MTQLNGAQYLLEWVPLLGCGLLVFGVLGWDRVFYMESNFFIHVSCRVQSLLS
jgi:hypothetical protein